VGQVVPSGSVGPQIGETDSESKTDARASLSARLRANSLIKGDRWITARGSRMTGMCREIVASPDGWLVRRLLRSHQTEHLEASGVPRDDHEVAGDR
jgi:hypothetical protein